MTSNIVDTLNNEQKNKMLKYLIQKYNIIDIEIISIVGNPVNNFSDYFWDSNQKVIDILKHNNQVVVISNDICGNFNAFQPPTCIDSFHNHLDTISTILPEILVYLDKIVLDCSRCGLQQMVLY